MIFLKNPEHLKLLFFFFLNTLYKNIKQIEENLESVAPDLFFLKDIHNTLPYNTLHLDSRLLKSSIKSIV